MPLLACCLPLPEELFQRASTFNRTEPFHISPEHPKAFGFYRLRNIRHGVAFTVQPHHDSGDFQLTPADVLDTSKLDMGYLVALYEFIHHSDSRINR